MTQRRYGAFGNDPLCLQLCNSSAHLVAFPFNEQEQRHGYECLDCCCQACCAPVGCWNIGVQVSGKELSWFAPQLPYPFLKPHLSLQCLSSPLNPLVQPLTHLGHWPISYSLTWTLVCSDVPGLAQSHGPGQARPN